MLYKPQFVFAHFLSQQIILPNEIVEESDRYAFIQNWYTDTEKVFMFFTKLRFVDKLDTLLY
jgi:hypothetical protein